MMRIAFLLLSIFELFAPVICYNQRLMLYGLNHHLNVNPELLGLTLPVIGSQKNTGRSSLYFLIF